MDNHLFAITSLGALAWKFDLGSPSAALTTVASDGTVYACPPVGGIFYALNSGGGAEWGFQVGGEAAFGAAVLSQDGEVIYFAARDSTDASTLGYFYSLFALRKDGTVKWKFTPPGHDLTAHAPAISPDGRTLYCPGYGRPEAALYGVDTSGNLRWRYSVSTTNSAVSGTSSPSLDNAGNLYFAGGGTLYSITAAGALRWKAENIGWLAPSVPAIGWDGTIYVVGTKLWAVDRNGDLKWSVPLGASNSSPAIDRDGTIYVGASPRSSAVDTSSLYAFNSDGSTKFKLTLRNSSGEKVDVTSSPAICSDGCLYIGSDAPWGRRLFKIR